jgi:hypothetical protein
MAESALQEVCRLTEPPSVPRQMFWPGMPVTLAAWVEQLQAFRKGLTETFVEALQQFRESTQAQVHAYLKAIEAGGRATAARKPEECCARLVEFWQKSLDCLLPVAQMQMQAARFAEALGRHVAGGMEAVSEAEYQERLAACGTCEFFQDDHCLKCGCRMTGDVIAKARWPSETCPIGRWASPSKN